MDEPDVGQWLTLAEIETRTSRKIGAVRSWYQRGKRAEKLRTQKNNRGEVQVWLTPELEAELHHPTGASSSLDSSLSDDALADARLLVDDLTGLVSDLRIELKSTSDALSDARVSQAKAEGERDTAKAVAAAELAGRDALLEQLRAELAEARRPWWRR